MAVKMMHCCFDRTGRRIRSTEREGSQDRRRVLHHGEQRRKEGYGDGAVTSQHTQLSFESRNRTAICLGVPLPALKDTIAG